MKSSSWLWPTAVADLAFGNAASSGDRITIRSTSAVVTGTNAGASKQTGEPNHADNSGCNFISKVTFNVLREITNLIAVVWYGGASGNSKLAISR